MKTLYLECSMGAAGDMLTAALAALLPDYGKFIEKMNALALPGVHVALEPSIKCGIQGLHCAVHIHGKEEHDHHNHDHHHSNIEHISHMIRHLPVSERVKANALAVYDLLAAAESHVHGKPVDQIHFHEVGALDAVADIVAVCLLMEELAPAQIIASPVCVGGGFVRCAHGILPVPAPATAYLLRGIPFYSGKVESELCTPTGAALLRYFAARFERMPELRVEKIGYGMGQKDFETANVLRAFWGETAENPGRPNETVAELRCNLDDMSAEAMGYAFEQLLRAGARDVYVTPVQMKKNRPGALLTCICGEAQADQFAALLLKHTSSFGVRKAILQRYTLERAVRTVQTPCGDIRVKTGTGYGVTKSKPEYEDVAAAAQANGLSFAEVIAQLEAADAR